MAVAAQGMAAPRPAGRVDLRHFRRAMAAMGVLQIDSVNVVERAHQLTLFSRLGVHDRDLLWKAFGRREVFEYWAHMASFSPVADWPLLRFRMDREREPWRGIKKLEAEHPGYIGSVYDDVAERGPLTAADLADQRDRSTGSWWGWSSGKLALEWLFAAGRLTSAGRVGNFARAYDLPERVIPAEHLAAPAVPVDEARRILLLRAAKALAVATARDLADYYRLSIVPVRAAVADLAAAGLIEEVEVEGWSEPAYLHPEAVVPRRLAVRSLICPFDPLIWFRERTERLFEFHYRIEIYTPKAKRRYGYYVLPFLLGDRLVARVDLKADREGSRLLVPGAFGEPGAEERTVAGPLAAELQDMAVWLGLDAVRVGERGDLAAPLRAMLG
jgi:uncharacterized protein YcaQ